MFWKNGRPVVDIIFDGKNSNMGNWFERSKVEQVISGPNVARNARYNYWSWNPYGSGTAARNFYISLNHGGCANDRGLIVVDDWYDECGNTLLLKLLLLLLLF